MQILTSRGVDPEVVAAAATCLREGGLVVFPTDTLYGLAAAAGNDEAVARLFQAKNRPPDQALPILIADPEEMQRLSSQVSSLALRLASRYWPGPLTIVVTAGKGFRSLALAGGDSVGLRVPDNEFARAMVRALGEPVTGTSANVTGMTPPATATEAAAQLGDLVDLVVDGGPCPVAIESTVIDLRGAPRLLREGAILREEIESLVGPLQGVEE